MCSKTWLAQVNAALHCHATKLFYLSTVMHNAHPTASGIVPELKGSIANLKPQYFRLNFVGHGQKWYRVTRERGSIVTRFDCLSF